MKKNNLKFLSLIGFLLTSCGSNSIKKYYSDTLTPVEDNKMTQKYLINENFIPYFFIHIMKYKEVNDKNNYRFIVNDLLNNSTCYHDIMNDGGHRNEILFITENVKFSIQFENCLLSSKYFTDSYCMGLYDYKSFEYYQLIFKDKNLHEKLLTFYDYSKNNLINKEYTAFDLFL